MSHMKVSGTADKAVSDIFAFFLLINHMNKEQNMIIIVNITQNTLVIPMSIVIYYYLKILRYSVTCEISCKGGI